ncbi:MAG: CvpA family protein [Lachnospiraceae bacterium]|nr:CvpA family protein [Lachnospiraceae bacterium]MBQ4069407.1 CvpA family protein [Lachnospiraceae bacterium]
MDYLVLICVILMLTVCAVNGYKQGAIKIALTLVASIVSVFLAISLAQPFSDFIKENTALYTNIEESMHTFVQGYMNEELDKKADELTEDMLKDLPLPEEISDILLKNNNKDTLTQMGAVSIADYICKELANMIVNTISFIILFILISIAIRIILSVADVIAKLPLVKEVNKLAGVAVGLAEGLIVVWIFFIVVTALTSTEFGQIVMEQVKNNQILSFIYDNNLLLKLLMSVM